MFLFFSGMRVPPHKLADPVAAAAAAAAAAPRPEFGEDVLGLLTLHLEEGADVLALVLARCEGGGAQEGDRQQEVLHG